MNYNGFGKRISKTYSTGESYSYLYDGQNVLMENSLQYTGGRVLYLTGGIDEIFSRTVNNTPEFYLTDNLNSLRKTTDAAQAIATTIDNKPFEELLSGDAGNHNYLFTGREKDFNDLYYYRARTYSPITGTFMQKDPIGVVGGINLYSYVNNNPLSYIDPLGYSGSSSSGFWGNIGNTLYSWVVEPGLALWHTAVTIFKWAIGIAKSNSPGWGVTGYNGDSYSVNVTGPTPVGVVGSYDF